MAASTKHKIVIIGCGNLAWHLASEFARLKFDLVIVNHRPNKELNKFERKFTCKTYSSLSLIPEDANFYFISVTDKSIPSVSKRITPSNKNAVVFHCSGSISLEALQGDNANRCVFYPVQTFSKNDSIDWKEVPILLEANSPQTLVSAKRLANLFSKKVEKSTWEFRSKVHLAAVFVNNFSNALYAAAVHLLSRNGKVAKVDLLLPLIRQTTKKLDALTPIAAQTGPAKRGDKPVLSRHMTMLKNEPELQKIYRLLSALILKQQQDA